MANKRFRKWGEDLNNLRSTPQEEQKSIDLIQKIYQHREKLDALKNARNVAINNRNLDSLVYVNSAINEEERRFEETARELRALHSIWFKRIDKVAKTYER